MNEKIKRGPKQGIYRPFRKRWDNTPSGKQRLIKALVCAELGITKNSLYNKMNGDQPVDDYEAGRIDSAFIQFTGKPCFNE
jgi:hypothetical protein